MKKIKLVAQPFLYPMPAVVVGVLCQGKPNYTTVAYCGIINHYPPMLYVALSKRHYSVGGILENKCFSINIGTVSTLERVDYCGIVSGHKEDKGTVFSAYYRDDFKCPLIEESPLNLSCTLFDVLDLGGNDYVFLGKIEAIYADESILENKVPNIKSLNPLIFDNGNNGYWGLGDYLAPAYKIGKKFRNLFSSNQDTKEEG
jgi:flavin reductase (DIM6/NTAB) family NADH-FMN oxidoreductase RutF